MEANFSDGSRRLRGIFLGNIPRLLRQVWSIDRQKPLWEYVEFPPEFLTADDLESRQEWLREIDVIFSTWGMPRLTARQLDWMPELKAVFYAGGTVKEFAEPLHDRNLTLVSAWAANAVPVAEFPLAQILLALKLGWPHVRQLAAHPGPEGWKWMEVRGVYGASVGIISLGMIGAKVIELLRPFSVNVQAFDPFVGEETMAQMGVKKWKSPNFLPLVT